MADAAQSNAVPSAAGSAAEPNWREDVYQALKELDIRQVHYVPDAGHAHVIERCLADPEIEAGMLANEFEGIGACCGAWLGEIGRAHV